VLRIVASGGGWRSEAGWLRVLADPQIGDALPPHTKVALG
jgi:hypothetical protein